LKKEQVLLLSETVREKDIFQLLCRLSRLRQKRLLCMIALELRFHARLSWPVTVLHSVSHQGGAHLHT